MRKHAVSIAFGAAILCRLSYASDRVSSYGSNPFLSRALFPQDIAAWKSNMLFLYPGYKKLPYWGDIDQPRNRPDDGYTTTGIDYLFNDANFRHSATIHSIDGKIGYLHNFRSGPVPVSCVDLDWNIEQRYAHAEGNLTGGSSGMIPFDYSMLHSLGAFHAQGVMAFAAFGAPAGLRIEGGFQTTRSLDHHFRFKKAGVDYSSERTVWGWSTSRCDRIFGTHGAEGDAWLQNGYALGPVYDVTLQGGTTLPLGKMGVELGRRSGRQEYYRWRQDSSTISDSVIKKNFIGSYQKGGWSGTVSDFFSRLYGNIAVKKDRRYSFNTFVALEYTSETQGEALSNNVEISRDSRDKNKGIFFTAAPNISIPFVPFFGSIDIAIPLSYAYSRFDNTDMLSAGGSRIETWRDSHTGKADENYRQPYSYAGKNVMDAGIDLYAMYPLFSNDIHRLGLGFQLLLNTRLTYMTKYYGRNTVSGDDAHFALDNLRKDFEKEIRFASGVKLQYQRAPYFAWIELTGPLLRSFIPRTRVYDAGGQQILYEHEKSPLWMSQEELRAAVYIAYEWTPPRLGDR